MQRLWLVALLSFVIDQASKWGVMIGLGMDVGDELPILPPLLVFKFGWNPGINFGLFSGNPDLSRWVLTALAIGVSVAIVIWAKRSFSRPVSFVAAGLIVGGALANGIDRVIHGAVADFLNMSCCGIDNPFIFNIADIFIFAGAGLLIAFDEPKKEAT